MIRIITEDSTPTSERLEAARRFGNGKAALTVRNDLYNKNGLQAETKIQEILDQAPSQEGKTVLVLRAYSSSFKAKNSECLTGTMLKDFGPENVLDRYDDLLEDISPEEIIRVDPDYILPKEPSTISPTPAGTSPTHIWRIS